MDIIRYTVCIPGFPSSYVKGWAEECLFWWYALVGFCYLLELKVHIWKLDLYVFKG